MKPRSWASTRRGGAPPVWQPEALVILVGAFGLLAWLLDVDVLKSISPNWSAMRANEAFSFALVGVAGRSCSRPGVSTSTPTPYFRT